MDKVFINESPFVADSETVEQVLTVLFNAGWRYCSSREGWYDPDAVAQERQTGRDTFLASHDVVPHATQEREGLDQLAEAQKEIKALRSMIKAFAS